MKKIVYTLLLTTALFNASMAMQDKKNIIFVQFLSAGRFPTNQYSVFANHIWFRIFISYSAQLLVLMAGRINLFEPVHET